MATNKSLDKKYEAETEQSNASDNRKSLLLLVSKHHFQQRTCETSNVKFLRWWSTKQAIHAETLSTLLRSWRLQKRTKITVWPLSVPSHKTAFYNIQSEIHLRWTDTCVFLSGVIENREGRSLPRDRNQSCSETMFVERSILTDSDFYNEYRALKCWRRMVSMVHMWSMWQSIKSDWPLFARVVGSSSFRVRQWCSAQLLILVVKWHCYQHGVLMSGFAKHTCLQFLKFLPQSVLFPGW